MTFTNILLIVIITLLVHSLIGTLIFIISNENEDFITYYGIGIIGILVSFICNLIRLIKRCSFHYNKRSIFEDNDGNKFYCKLKYTNDFNWHNYHMIKRYATKDEWKCLKPASKEQISAVLKNCDRCKYNETCTFDTYRVSADKIKCNHDEFGTVTEFNKFESK